MNRKLLFYGTYCVDYSNDADPCRNFVGLGVFVCENPEGYDKGTLEFKLLDDSSGCEFGYFDIDDIGEMVADPRKAKLDAIYKHAIDLELPDVAGVIETKIKEYAQQAGVSGT